MFIFIYLFINQDLNRSNYVLSNDVMINELERLWKKGITT
jgi:hypothetical protein